MQLLSRGVQAAGVAFVVLLGCGCSPSRYCIRRTALVPVPSPSPRPARMADSVFEAGVASDVVLWARPPDRYADRNVGLHVPRVQLGGYFAFAWHSWVSLGLSWELGLPQGALPIAEGLVGGPDAPVGGMGNHVNFHFPLNDWLLLDVGCDVWAYAIQSHIEYAEADDGSACDGASAPVASQWSSRDVATLVIVARGWAALGANLGWSDLSVSFGVRNQPVNVDATEELHDSPSDISPELSNVAYPYVSLLWEIHIQRWAHLGVTVYQPLAFDPVIYAPVVGASLRFTAGEVPTGRRWLHES